MSVLVFSVRDVMLLDGCEMPGCLVGDVVHSSGVLGVQLAVSMHTGTLHNDMASPLEYATNDTYPNQLVI